MKREDERNIAVEIMNARHPVKTAIVFPPSSLIKRAIRRSIEAPARAGNNLTKNSWYPKRLFIIKERKDITGGVEANPHAR